MSQAEQLDGPGMNGRVLRLQVSARLLHFIDALQRSKRISTCDIGRLRFVEIKEGITSSCIGLGVDGTLRRVLSGHAPKVCAVQDADWNGDHQVSEPLIRVAAVLANVLLDQAAWGYAELESTFVLDDVATSSETESEVNYGALNNKD